MKKWNWHSRNWNLLLIIACIVGITLNVLTFRTALRQDDNFRIVISFGWIIIFTVSAIRNYFSYRRKSQAQEGMQ